MMKCWTSVLKNILFEVEVQNGLKHLTMFEVSPEKGSFNPSREAEATLVTVVF
jgi:hypothetical protein